MSDDVQTKEKDEGAGGQMTLIEHLTELRNRLGVALLAFVVLFLVCVAPMPGKKSTHFFSCTKFFIVSIPFFSCSGWVSNSRQSMYCWICAIQKNHRNLRAPQLQFNFLHGPSEQN